MITHGLKRPQNDIQTPMTEKRSFKNTSREPDVVIRKATADIFFAMFINQLLINTATLFDSFIVSRFYLKDPQRILHLLQGGDEFAWRAISSKEFFMKETENAKNIFKKVQRKAEIQIE